jgi:hypothetical protein
MRTLHKAAGLVLLAALGMGAGSLAEWATRPASEAPLDLAWQDLVPQGGWLAGTAVAGVLKGVVEHGTATPDPEQETELVTAHEGKRVRLAGYLLPIDFDGVGVREFLLVPYVGACIHVPPPPPNQIVLVRSETRIPIRDQFEPVQVTGTFSTGLHTTDLAEVGYQVAAEAVIPYAEP